MRKIVFGLLTISLFVSSCRDDKNEESNSNTTSIVGTWKMQNNEVLSGKDLKIVLKEYLPNECKKKSTFQFTDNGKYILHDFNLTNGECKEFSLTKNYQYISSDKKLIFEGSNDAADVIEISNHKLIFVVNDHYDYNEDGTDDYLRYTFVK